MKTRVVASAVIASGLMLGLGGCAYVVPQATAEQFDRTAPISDGVSEDVGDTLQVRNALLVSDDGEDANLITTFINSGTEPIVVALEWESSTALGSTNVSVPAQSTLDIGHGDDEESVTLRGVDEPVGSIVEVYLSFPGTTGVELGVPMLDGGLPEYEGLAP